MLFMWHIIVGIIHTIIYVIFDILFCCILGVILISIFIFRDIVFIIVLVRSRSFRILLVIIVVTIIFFVHGCSI